MTIKEAREQQGMSRRNLSDWLEIPYRTLTNWENGERSCPAYIEKLIVEKILADGRNINSMTGKFSNIKLVYVALFTPYSDGTSGYTVEFPDLPGCVTGGDDMMEALLMAEDAASGWILTELEEGKLVPKATPLQKIIIKAGQFTSLVMLDMEAYATKYGLDLLK